MILLTLVAGAGIALALYRLLSAAGVRLVITLFVATLLGSLASALMMPAFSSTDIETSITIWLMGVPLVLVLSCAVWLKLRLTGNAPEE